jgi:hypothetical protein
VSFLSCLDISPLSSSPFQVHLQLILILTDETTETATLLKTAELMQNNENFCPEGIANFSDTLISRPFGKGVAKRAVFGPLDS